MKILLIYPKYPHPLGSFNPILNLFKEKPIFPPKELLLSSILLPIPWERKLVDMNTEKLCTKDILWADYIFINANEKQYKSTIKAIDKCKSFEKKIIAGGSLFTEYYNEFENLEHLVLDNIRITLPQLINDIENQNPKNVYHSNPFFEIRKATESYYSVRNISSRFSQSIKLAYD